MGNHQAGGHESANGSPRVIKSDSTDSGVEPLSKEEMEERFAELVDMMDLPDDKKVAVLQSSQEKKWQLVRDNTRRRRQLPPMAYISKFQYVMDADSARKARRRALDSGVIQMLQGLEISLRTNHIGWVQEFLHDENQGLRELVKYMSFRCQVEMQLSHKQSLKRAQSIDTSVLDSPRISHRSNGRLEEGSMDLHVCVLCLKALMNNAHGFAAVMKDPDAITRMALSMFFGTQRTVITVIELLAAVCLVKGGHIKILQAVDNFKQENGEQYRFEKLVNYFMDDNATPEFQVACMNFINVIVHSAEDLNFRVHLQHEFTLLGLDGFIEDLKSNPNVVPVLLNQITAYEQNYIQVHTLLEDSNTKAKAMATVESLKEHIQEIQDKHQAEEFQSLKRIAELEKQLAEMKRAQEGRVVGGAASSQDSSSSVESSPEHAVANGAPPPPPPGVPGAPPPPPPPGAPGAPPPPPPPPGVPGAPPPPPPPGGPGVPPPPPPPGAGPGRKGISVHPMKRKIETKYRLPLLNWSSLPATQIPGTVFTELDDESILRSLDFSQFEETFKPATKATPTGNGQAAKEPKAEHTLRKSVHKQGLLDTNRSQNVAIARKRITDSTESIKHAITHMDLQQLPLDSVEILIKLTPNEEELKKFKQFTDDKKSADTLPENDRFLFELSQMERLRPRLQVMVFIGNFEDDMTMLSSQVDAVIAASKSVVKSGNLKRILEILLAFGNYMNSSKRGGVYGFRLQSLDIISDTRAPMDPSVTLMHFVAGVVKEKYPKVSEFVNELNYLEKAAAVSLQLLGVDIRLMSKGMKEATKELVNNKHNKQLKKFCLEAEPRVTKLESDFETAKESFLEVVQYFGENAKSAQPNTVFPVLHRFVCGYRKAESENAAKLKQAQMKLELKPQFDDDSAFSEDVNSPNVLPQIYDGAIDELITGMKSNAYRPADTRLRRKSILCSTTSTEGLSSAPAPPKRTKALPKPPVKPRHKVPA